MVDNLPPQMLHTLADLVSRTPQALPKLAVVIDVRGREVAATVTKPPFVEVQVRQA